MMMRNMMQGSNPGVMAENARTLRNQGQPEDMALKMAAKQAAMGAAGGSAMGSLGAGGMQKEVMPGAEAMGGVMGGGMPHGDMMGAGAAMGGDSKMMPLPSDPNAPQGNAPAIAIPGAGNPLPPGMGDGGASGGSDPNGDPNAPQPEMSQWIQQLMSRMHQGGSMGGQAQGGMSTLAGMLGKR